MYAHCLEDVNKRLYCEKPERLPIPLLITLFLKPFSVELYVGLMRNTAALFSKTPLTKLFGMTSDNENDDNSFVLKLNLLTTA